MSAQAIRRYLQPASNLRWHPWAPLIAGGVLVALVFILGAQWGYSAAKRERQIDRYSYASLVRVEQKPRFPAMDLRRKAGAIDAAVLKYVRESREQTGAWEAVRAQAERWILRGGRKPLTISRESMVDLAEFRLGEMGGSAPLWQVTSTYCQEMWPTLTGVDLRDPMAAEAYSTLLGRPVAAEQLAPAVPNARCEPTRRMQ